MTKNRCWDNGDKSKFGKIWLHQTGRDSFTVTYGLQVKKHLTYGKAATELGAAIMHRAACEGKLDNREPGER